jgi:hypothetical protein
VTFKILTKNEFFPQVFFASYLPQVHLNYSSKKTSCLKSRKTVENKVSLFFCLLMEGSRSAQIIMDLDSGGLKIYGSGTLRLAGAGR